MTDENQRQAATIRVGISNYVGTAALAVLAGEAAFFTFAQQVYALWWLFYGLVGLAALLIVLSMIAGGQGAASIAKKVADGTYSGEKIPKFNKQAILTLLAMVIVIAAIPVALSASPRRTQQDNCAEMLSQELSVRHPVMADILRAFEGCEVGKGT